MQSYGSNSSLPPSPVIGILRLSLPNLMCLLFFYISIIVIFTAGSFVQVSRKSRKLVYSESEGEQTTSPPNKKRRGGGPQAKSSQKQLRSHSDYDKETGLLLTRERFDMKALCQGALPLCREQKTLFLMDIP